MQVASEQGIVPRKGILTRKDTLRNSLDCSPVTYPSGSVTPIPPHRSLHRGFQLLYQLTGQKQPGLQTERSVPSLQSSKSDPTPLSPKRKPTHFLRQWDQLYMEKLKLKLDTPLHPLENNSFPMSDVEQFALFESKKQKTLRLNRRTEGETATLRPRTKHHRSSVLKRILHLPALTPRREPQFKPTGAIEHLLCYKSISPILV